MPFAKDYGVKIATENMWNWNVQKNEAKFAESKVTNTFYKRKPKNVSGSQKEYSFNLTYLTPESNKDTVYVFEAPVDLLSHATMYVISEKKRAERLGQKPDYDVWKKQNRLSLSGTSDVALQSYLQRYPEIKNIVLCLDNDEAGRNGIAKVNQKYADRYSITVHVPKLGKDYNETLVRYLTVAEKATEQRTVDNSEEVAVTKYNSAVTLIQKIQGVIFYEKQEDEENWCNALIISCRIVNDVDERCIRKCRRY